MKPRRNDGAVGRHADGHRRLPFERDAFAERLQARRERRLRMRWRRRVRLETGDEQPQLALLDGERTFGGEEAVAQIANRAVERGVK